MIRTKNAFVFVSVVFLQCETSTNNRELIRVTLVNETDECVYDALVKPHSPIINYKTEYSTVLML